MSLREVREEKGIKQVDLAEKAGINVQVLRHYEQGFRDINGCKLKTLLTICDVLSCRLSDIITDTETLELLKKVKK